MLMPRCTLWLWLCMVMASANLVTAGSGSSSASWRTTLFSSSSSSSLSSSPSSLSSSNEFAIVPVTMADDGTYYIVLEVGKISFRMAIDTGSADTWLVSTACRSTTCSTLPRYPLGYASPSFEVVNDNLTAFDVGYADGSAASGFVARETIQVSNVTVSNQTIGLVTTSNVTLIDKVSGVLGLGFPRLSEIYMSTVNATPFFATLASEGVLGYPIFGLSLSRNSSGVFTLGAVDVSVVQNVSDIVWNEVVPFSPVGTRWNTSGYLYWAIQITGFSVNGTSMRPLPTYPEMNDNTSIALLDVGTNGLFGPYQDVTRLFGLIPASRIVDQDGQWAMPCDSSVTISFTFGANNTFVLQPSDYLIGATAGNPDLCLCWPRASPPSADGIDWQLGTPFLRTVYSVWSYGIDDEEPPMIGLYSSTNQTTNNTVESPAVVESYLSSASATVETILPNSVLPTRTYTRPTYAFNTSVGATMGEVVESELAPSTYSAILMMTPSANASGLPIASDEWTAVYTDSMGNHVTSTYHVMDPTGVQLGVPPGSSSGGLRRGKMSWAWLLILATAIWGGPGNRWT